jgi:hypothetical protein
MHTDDLVTSLKPFLDRIQALLEENDRIEERGAPYKTKPYPPATEAQIAAREKALNFQFPPLYRAFLRIHNGWKGFPVDFAMFGVSGPGYLRPAKDLASYVKIFEKTFRRQGRNRVGDLKQRERVDPDLIYMPHHPPIASDFNGQFTVFDRNRPLPGGEYEIADVSSGQFVGERFQGFRKLLDDVYSRARATLIDLGGDPERVEASTAGTAAPGMTRQLAAKKEKARGKRSPRGLS